MNGDYKKQKSKSSQTVFTNRKKSQIGCIFWSQKRGHALEKEDVLSPYCLSFRRFKYGPDAGNLSAMTK